MNGANGLGNGLGNGNGVNVQRHPSTASMPSVPPPPPLAPRPPREYIEETREEDARTTAKLHAIDSSGAGVAVGDDFKSPHISMKPFTPFTPGFNMGMGGVPPPPLPTKVGD